MTVWLTSLMAFTCWDTYLVEPQQSPNHSAIAESIPPMMHWGAKPTEAASNEVLAL